jgi:hypothetical protein
MTIDLRKFEDEYSNKDPELVSLTKQFGISLSKNKLSNEVAKVAVCLDVSYSMNRLYSSGKVGELVKKLIPAGLNFDDDGEIDIFQFGQSGKQQDSINLDNYNQRTHSLKDQRLEGYTNYSEAIKLVDNFYRNQPDKNLTPVFVIFVTDGDASDKAKAIEAIRKISDLPIFFQFVAIGEDYNPLEANEPVKEEPKKGFFGKLFGSSSSSTNSQYPTSFKFLHQLDELDGRNVDNAGFFAVKEIDSLSDKEMYDLLLSEYPSFLKEAKAKGILQ